MNTQLIDIANQATFLSEKIEAWTFDKCKKTSEGVDQFVSIWKENLASEYQQNFTKRIAIINIKEEQLGSLLTYPLYSSLINCPGWILNFEKLLNVYQRQNKHIYSFISKKYPVPFQDIIAPLIIYIRDNCNFYTNLLSLKAREKLEHSILKSLSDLLAPCLYLELYLFSESNNSSSLDYIGFVNQFLTPDSNNFRISLFQEYPVLARLLTSEINNWITFLTYFSTSIDKDYEEVKMFINSGNLGNILDVEIGISDKHDSGKSVIRVVFENKKTIYFKPRDTGLEKDFFEFVGFLNELNSNTDFKIKVPGIIQKTGYSWVEAIQFKNISDHESLKKYYSKCGNLLYITHLFNGTDFHYENIICNGEFPVLIDTETLLQSNTRKFKNEKKSNERDLILNSSVLMTLLLPQWQEKNDNSAYDIGGFSATACYTGIFEPNWKKINTPEMEIQFKEVYINPTTHKPSDSLDKYEEELMKGFIVAHELITAYKKQVIKKIEQEGWFKSQKTRVVIRPTKVYAKLIARLKHPDFLRSGIAYGIELEQLLLNAFETELTTEEQANWLIFYKAECDALQEMNIPIFHTDTNGLNLNSNNETVFSNCFLKSGFSLLLQNIENRDSNYLKEQSHIISCSIASRYSDELFRFRLPSKNGSTPNVDFLHIASLIGDILLSSTLKKTGKMIGFSSMKHHALTGKYNLQMVDDSFMSGQLGIAFYFAALFHATKEEKYLNATRVFLEDIIFTIEDEKHLQDLHLGLDGLGGNIYGLSKIASYINDANLFERCKNLIDYSKQREVTYLDQVFGVSGLINAIITWSKLTSDNRYSDYLRQLGNQIVEREYTKWGIELQEKPITGFSHGISGISHALVSIDHFLGSNKFSNRAISALEYESSLYDLGIKGWKDSREFMSEQNKIMFDWSHGAAGMGIARICIMQNSVLEEDLKRIKQSFNQNGHYLDEYNLANGVLGIVDFWTEHTDLGRESILDCLKQLKDQGMLNTEFHPIKKLAWQPSLFYGMAGLGYQLLRAFNPNRFPSILLSN